MGNGKAGQWTVDLRMGSGNVSSGITGGEVDMDGFWTGTGPTGTYAAGTIGSGQRIENTKADMLRYFPAGVGVKVYEYIFHDTYYDSGMGTAHTSAIAQGYNSYSI